ncbi:TPA: class I SAM-dependent methyltransferase, partial [Streptococcus agalactiae]|nr:class I SAM-dependent methyltransferase [Streptococcus agalactiae]
ITALDLDSKVIEKAKENVKKAQLEEFIEVIQGNALRLPFPDNSLSLSTKQC